VAVAITVAVPGVVDEVRVSVATPLESAAVLGLVSVPAVVLKYTVVPADTGLPLTVTVALMVEVLVPSAGMLVGLALTDTPTVDGAVVW
jgi:hypothetical protein